MRNEDGHLQLAIFQNAQQFEDEEPYKILYFDKTDISGGNKQVSFDLSSGTYALTVLDDEDDSQDMTYRFGIYPREGVGFSNFKLKGMSKPDFEDFDFKLTEDRTIKVDLRYFN